MNPQYLLTQQKVRVASADAVDVSAVMRFVCLQRLVSRSACVFVQSTSVWLNIRRTELISDSVGLFR